MQEIRIKENNLGLMIYINAVPDINLIPKEKGDSIIKALELEITLKIKLNEKAEK